MTNEKNMIPIQEFVARIQKLNSIKSRTGKAGYSSINVRGQRVDFKRDSTGNTESLRLDELYKAYSHLDYINTINIRPYIQGRKYSPACAILMAIKAYDKEGVRV